MEPRRYGAVADSARECWKHLSRGLRMLGLEIVPGTFHHVVLRQAKIYDNDGALVAIFPDQPEIAHRMEALVRDR